LDENLGTVVTNVLKYGSKYADDALKYGLNKVDDAGKYIGDKINKFKAGRTVTAAEKAAKAARRKEAVERLKKIRSQNRNAFKNKKNKGLGFGTGAALASLTSGGGNSSGSTGDQFKTSYRKLPEIEGRTSSFTQRVGGPTTTIATRDTQLNRKALQQNYQQNENTIQMLKTISEGETKIINFNDGNDISVGYSLAKKIINIYESLNKNNKQAMANMLDESIDNFKKISKFAIDNRN
jgi:hypothetical protein